MRGREGHGTAPVVLTILDGWGWREESADNAVALARTPCFDRLWQTCPRTFLRTDGVEVGLPAGQFGNSEVGHLNLGAGRIVLQDLPRIDQAIADGSLARSAEFQRLVEAALSGSARVHLMGLVSPGGVHAHQAHIAAVARLLQAAGAGVEIHAFLDGRDTPPRSAEGFLAELERETADVPGVRLATLCGRYWAMDRDRRWERTRRAHAAIVDADAPRFDGWRAALQAAYAAGQSDEFVDPAVLGGYTGVADGDSLLCANFRADRVRQILQSLLAPDFAGFPGRRAVRFAAAAGMTSYSEELDRSLLTLFPPRPMDDLLGAVLAAAGMRQLRMAETEKYPHVTFFFNGGDERPYPGEERILVPSPKVATYDLQPEMSARALTDRFVETIAERRFEFVLINFANPDMVGHTGKLDAAIRAVEVVDECLGRVVAAVRAVGGRLVVTADHGNCEMMRDPATGQPHTAHTTNPVPCVLVGAEPARALRAGRLADVAPTILELLGLPRPAAMTGRSLLAR